MAEPTFDRARYFERLTTVRIGRELIAHAIVDSTNDTAWQAFAVGAPDGLAVVADAQRRGRGRAGRVWHTTPGKALALSILLHHRGDRPLQILPLASGLALASALEALGVPARLKWPNDVLIGARKVAGILAESRGGAGTAASSEPADGPVSARQETRAVVVGVGVNASQDAADFPPELANDPDALAPTSLALEGFEPGREAIAAGFANALEPLWTDLARRGPAPLLAAWTRRASFWGETVRARTASGVITGIARALDADGALVLELPGGARTTVIAGDVLPAGASSTASR